jgi:hypothetical protein
VVHHHRPSMSREIHGDGLTDAPGGAGYESRSGLLI